MGIEEGRGGELSMKEKERRKSDGGESKMKDGAQKMG